MSLYQGNAKISGGGLTPYQIAVKNGYEGTEAEFNALLVGIKDGIYLKNQDYMTAGPVNTDNFNELIYGNGIWLASGGNENSLWYSSNLQDWHFCHNVVDANNETYEVSPCICFGEGLFIAIPDSPKIGIYTSTDAKTWELHSFDGTIDFDSGDWRCLGIGYGNGVFVAILQDYYSKIMYSVRSIDHGQTWTTYTMPSLESGLLSHHGIQFNETQFIMPLDNGELYYSTDGIEWVQNINLFTTLSAIGFTDIYCSRFECTQNLMIGYVEDDNSSDSVYVYSIDNGDTWNSSSCDDYDIALCVYDGAIWRAITHYEKDDDYFSITIDRTNNGTSWEQISSFTTEEAWNLCSWSFIRTEDCFFLFNCYDYYNNTITYSFDGKTWNYNLDPPYLATTDEQTLPEILKDIVIVQFDDDNIANYASAELYYLCSQGKYIVALYDDDIYLPSSLGSSSCTFVALSDTPESPIRYKITLKDNGEMIQERVKSNVLSLETINTNLPNHGAYTSVCFGNGIYRAVAEDGKTVYSEDGKSWKSGPTINWSSDYERPRITYGNGKFVAVSGDVYAYLEDSAYYWQTGTLDVFSTNIAYGADKFVAAGRGGVQYSTDGITWTAVELLLESGKNFNFNSIRYDKDKFIGINGYGNIAESSDGITWIIKNGLDGAFQYSDASVYWKCLAYNGEKYMAGGRISADNFGYTSSDAPRASGPFAAFSSDGETWQIASIEPLLSWENDQEFQEIIVNDDGVFCAVIFNFENKDSGEIVYWSDSANVWCRVNWNNELYEPNWSSICVGGTYLDEYNSERNRAVAISYGTENDIPMQGGVAAYWDIKYPPTWRCTGSDIYKGNNSSYIDDVQNKLIGHIFIDPYQITETSYKKDEDLQYVRATDEDLKLTCDYSSQELAKAAMSGKTVSLLWSNSIAQYLYSGEKDLEIGTNTYARFQLNNGYYIDVFEDKTVVFRKKPESISTGEQYLEEEEKAQARENIDAVSKTELNEVQSYTDTQIATRAPQYLYGTTDLVEGESDLATGVLYFVYE